MEWTSEERKQEVEGRINEAVEGLARIVFYDQDQERCLKAIELIDKFKALYE